MATNSTRVKSSKAASRVDSQQSQHSNRQLMHYGIESYPLDDNEPYMNPAQKAHLGEILMAWKQELLNGGDQTLSELKEANVLSDISDLATQEETFALRLRTRDRERKLIRKIDSTLDYLKTDDYGYCESCGIEIGMRRLEARPTATLCIDCKTLSEIREKQGR